MEQIEGPNGMADEPATYLIAGAYGGVGSTLARRLSGRGARLALLGRDKEKLDKIKGETDSLSYVVDISDFKQMAEVVQDVVLQLGRIDGAACLAGSLFIKPAHLTSESDWSEVISANLTTAFSMLKACARPMMRTGGSIVLSSSAACHVGLSNHDALSAAKSGIEGLVKASAATYSRYGLRVNCVAPGMLNTDMTSSVTANPALLSAAMELYSIKRVGDPADVAVVVDWLLGKDSSWVTGQSFVVDGGLSTTKCQAPVRTRIDSVAAGRSSEG